MKPDHKPSRLKTSIFIGSLALNVLIIFAFIGYIANPIGPMRGKVKNGINNSYQAAMIRALPHDKRHQLRNRFKEQRGLMHHNREQIHSLQNDLRNALVKNPFNREDIQIIFNQHHKINKQFLNLGDQIWLDLFSEMTSDERESFAKALHFKHRKK